MRSIDTHTTEKSTNTELMPHTISRLVKERELLGYLINTYDKECSGCNQTNATDITVTEI